MPIARRVPEMTAAMANRLKAIDAFGQPQGRDAMNEAQGFVYYGWVHEHEWSLTDAGRTALKAYHDERAAGIKERDQRHEQARMTAR